MKYALVNNIKKEATTSGEVGTCPLCKSDVRAHCGEKYIHHWKHISKSHCDPWWENETQWHRDWKNHFPIEWQEIVHKADDGEKHIADVKTNDGWVIEFQHSYLNPEERRSRNEFYSKLVWIIDGSRRKTDLKLLKYFISEHVTTLNQKPLIIGSTGNFRLLKEWDQTKHLVLIDFNNSDEHENSSNIWGLLPAETDYNNPLIQFYFIQLSRANLIKNLKNGGFEKWFNEYILRKEKVGNLTQALEELAKKEYRKYEPCVFINRIFTRED